MAHLHLVLWLALGCSEVVDCEQDHELDEWCETYAELCGDLPEDVRNVAIVDIGWALRECGDVYEFRELFGKHADMFRYYTVSTRELVGVAIYGGVDPECSARFYGAAPHYECPGNPIVSASDL